MAGCPGGRLAREPTAHALNKGRTSGLQGQLLRRPARDLAGPAGSHLHRGRGGGGHSRVSGYGNRASSPVRVSFLLSEPFVHTGTQQQAFLRVLGPGSKGRNAPYTVRTHHPNDGSQTALPLPSGTRSDHFCSIASDSVLSCSWFFSARVFSSLLFSLL